MPLLEFNPECDIRVGQLFNGLPMVTIDNVLLEPERLVQHACDHESQMQLDPGSRFPGPLLTLPAEDQDIFVRFLRRRVFSLLNASRLVSEAYCRLSMVTLPPEQLSWAQRMCHRDGRPNMGTEMLCSSVLYLFRDHALGGTAFFSENQGVAPYHTLISPDGPTPEASDYDFFRRPAAYHTETNEFFSLRQTVSPRWNRLVIYQGDVPHSGFITNPARLSEDPKVGRLTLNGFFRVRKLSH